VEDGAKATSEWRHYTPEGAYRGSADQPPTGLRRVRHVWRQLQESWDVLVVFSTSRFRATYRAQVLGILWPMANPLILMIVIALVFGVVFRHHLEAYPVYIMHGLVLWHFVTHAWTQGTACLVQHGHIVKHTGVPTYVVATGTVFSHLFTLGFASLSLVPLVAFYPDAFRLSFALLLVPVLLLFIVLTMLGLVLATSVLNVLYRDVGYVVDSLLLVLFWATPIVWPFDRLPQEVHKFVLVSPLASILHCMRDVVMKGVLPPATVFGAAALTSVLTLVLGVLIHRRYAHLVPDHV